MPLLVYCNRIYEWSLFLNDFYYLFGIRIDKCAHGKIENKNEKINLTLLLNYKESTVLFFIAFECLDNSRCSFNYSRKTEFQKK
jgi:hypothetical protein